MTILEQYPDHKHLIEDIADLEHQQWMHWAKSMMNRPALKLPYTQRKNWENWMVPYSDLPEHIKELDRVWAVKIIDLIYNNPHSICPVCFSYRNRKLNRKEESK